MEKLNEIFNILRFLFFHSCTTKKLATNELPLEDDPEESTETSTFTHPLVISEEEEIAESAENATYPTSSDPPTTAKHRL